MSSEADKKTERDRYNSRAQKQLERDRVELGVDGADSQPPSIRRPYQIYEAFIRKHVAPGDSAIDLCCGTGLYSLIAARAGAKVTATDIAEHNLSLAQRRATRAGLPLATVACDAESIPFADQSFDLVTCAGSLSYVDPEIFQREVTRVLRPGGWFVCVDSLNHNPVYRLNRYLNFLRGLRTRSTLERMPTLGTVNRLQREFPNGELQFCGVFSFLAPFLRPFIGENRTAAMLDRLDLKWPTLHRWAFKFVFCGQRPVESMTASAPID